MAKIGYARVSTPARRRQPGRRPDRLRLRQDLHRHRLRQARRPPRARQGARLPARGRLSSSPACPARCGRSSTCSRSPTSCASAALLVVLKQQIDTTTPTGRLVFHILGAIDGFQRELIIEGTREDPTPPAPAPALGPQAQAQRGQGCHRAPHVPRHRTGRQAAGHRRRDRPDPPRTRTTVTTTSRRRAHMAADLQDVPGTPGRSFAACCAAATPPSTRRPRSLSPTPSRPHSSRRALPPPRRRRATPPPAASRCSDMASEHVVRTDFRTVCGQFRRSIDPTASDGGRGHPRHGQSVPGLHRHQRLGDQPYPRRTGSLI